MFSRTAKLKETIVNFFRKKKEESNLVVRDIDGQKQLIHRDVVKLVEKDFVRPTLEKPEVGVCNTCNKDKVKFLYQLRNLENPESCFMKGHDVEPLAGIPWHRTEDFQKQLQQWEYVAWKDGEMGL